MQALILTEAGRGRGNGHVSRCTGLLEAFHQSGHEAQMWVDSDQPLSDGIATGDWKRDLDRFLPLRAPRNLVTVVDSYEADRTLLETIAARSRSCCFFDDDARLDYPDGALVNAAVDADLLYPTRREGVRYLTGPRYAVLRKEFWKKRPYKIRNRIEAVLIALGSSVTIQQIQAVISTLKDLLPAAAVKVLHESAPQWRTPISEVDWLWNLSPEQIADLALGCDLAICSGGQILIELASLWVPAATIATAENQHPNVAGSERAGFSTHLGELDDPSSLSRLRSLMPLLSKTSERRRRSHRGRKFIDGRGAARIVRVLETTLHAGNA
jgi:UDP-2,4-diacetamido-2,4,6-trideoxy-beta-L-altropyranose hydrolase